jgi:hypothetical protein
MSSPAPDVTEWESTLDALEDRLARQEASLVEGSGDTGFEAVRLPSTPPEASERVRALLALERVRALEAQLRRLHERSTQPTRPSPYS